MNIISFKITEFSHFLFQYWAEMNPEAEASAASPWIVQSHTKCRIRTGTTK